MVNYCNCVNEEVQRTKKICSGIFQFYLDLSLVGKPLCGACEDRLDVEGPVHLILISKTRRSLWHRFTSIRFSEGTDCLWLNITDVLTEMYLDFIMTQSAIRLVSVLLTDPMCAKENIYFVC